ncbi:MAG TPA: hypothetical protein VKT81_28190 [Bryobacteraceae bacterium]|nr:hypothetical protein [Bryobacteraceae bacterium]
MGRIGGIFWSWTAAWCQHRAAGSGARKAIHILVRQGHDPQLEETVEVLLADLEKNPIPVHKKPAYPVYGKQ